MPHCNWLSAFITAFLLPLVDAFYYIDDSNSSITYGAGSIYTGVGSTTASSPWVSYPPLPIAKSWLGWSVDPEKAFNGTYHYFNWPEYPEYRQNPWTMDIPFTGSGITFYAISSSKISVSIDGDRPRKLNNDCETCYNYSLFDIQGLYTDKPHNLHVVCLDVQLLFDYVKVNDTVLLPRSPAATPATSLVSSKSNIGAIIGGTIGGLVVIAVILFLLLRVRGRKKSATTEMDSEKLALTGEFEVSSSPVAMDRTPSSISLPLSISDPTISNAASWANLPSLDSSSTLVSAIPDEYTSLQTITPPKTTPTEYRRNLTQHISKTVLRI